MATKSNNPYYGIYYISHGKWTGPYMGKTYTLRGLTRQPLKDGLQWLKNKHLKSRIHIRPMQKAK